MDPARELAQLVQARLAAPRARRRAAPRAPGRPPRAGARSRAARRARPSATARRRAGRARAGAARRRRRARAAPATRAAPRSAPAAPRRGARSRARAPPRRPPRGRAGAGRRARDRAGSRAIRRPCSSTSVHPPAGRLTGRPAGVDEAAGLRQPVGHGDATGRRAPRRARPARRRCRAPGRAGRSAPRSGPPGRAGCAAARPGTRTARWRAAGSTASRAPRPRRRRRRARPPPRARGTPRPTVQITGASTRRCGSLAARQRRHMIVRLTAITSSAPKNWSRSSRSDSAWSGRTTSRFRGSPAGCSSNSSDGICSTVVVK